MLTKHIDDFFIEEPPSPDGVRLPEEPVAPKHEPEDTEESMQPKPKKRKKKSLPKPDGRETVL